MKFLSRLKSGRWSFLAIALIMAALWGALLFQNMHSSSPQVSGAEKQAAYAGVLPNFLAPVIRKEVHKEASAEEETIAIKFSIPRINYFSVWH